MSTTTETERCLTLDVYWDTQDPANNGWAWNCDAESGPLSSNDQNISVDDAKDLAREALADAANEHLVHTVRVYWRGETDPLVLSVDDLFETRYEVQSRTDGGEWRSDGLGDANEFVTEAEAEQAISELQALGDDWAAAEYRVVEVAS